VGVSLYRRCKTVVFHSWWQYIESMCVLYIDIVIVSVDLATIRYFDDFYPSAMTLGGHLDYSHLQMSLAVKWPTASMLLLVVFVGLASFICSYVFPIWCLINVGQEENSWVESAPVNSPYIFLAVSNGGFRKCRHDCYAVYPLFLGCPLRCDVDGCLTRM
jgi:hypothetical protein